MLVMVVVFVIVVVVFVFCHGLPMVRFGGRDVERRDTRRWLATRSTNRPSAHVRKLIEARQYVLNSDWGEVQPRTEDENAYLKRHSWEEYASWFLGLTQGATEDTKGRYAFVFGDFRRCTAPGSSPATIGRPIGGTRSSSWRRTTFCSCWTGKAA